MSDPVNVPQDWSIRQVENLAFRVDNLRRIFGARIDFRPWAQRFCPEAKEDSAARQWERLKASFVAAGICFSLTDCPMPVADDETNGAESGRLSIRFSSERYMERVVEALIGPPLDEEEWAAKKPKGRSLYDFFPGEDPDEVEALMDLLAEDLRAKLPEAGSEAA